MTRKHLIYSAIAALFAGLGVFVAVRNQPPTPPAPSRTAAPAPKGPVEALFAQFPLMLDFYEATVGPYPFGDEKMGVVETPHLGMEHQTINAYGNEYKLDGRGFDWLLHHGDNDGDGFIDYIDETGHGLANQGWKDSGDSIQWRSGELAEGPIALCEVQGYAYEAALAGADLLDHFGEPGAGELRA